MQVCVSCDTSVFVITVQMIYEKGFKAVGLSGE